MLFYKKQVMHSKINFFFFFLAKKLSRYSQVFTKNGRRTGEQKSCGWTFSSHYTDRPHCSKVLQYSTLLTLWKTYYTIVFNSSTNGNHDLHTSGLSFNQCAWRLWQFEIFPDNLAVMMVKNHQLPPPVALNPQLYIDYNWLCCHNHC